MFVTIAYMYIAANYEEIPFDTDIMFGTAILDLLVFPRVIHI